MTATVVRDGSTTIPMANTMTIASPAQDRGDMREDVYEIFKAKVQEIANLLDMEPSDSTDKPTRLWDTGGQYERLNAIWLIPDNTGQVWNHGFHIDQFSSKEIRMMAWGRGQQVRLELYGEGAEKDTISTMLDNIMPRQLRPEPEVKS